MKILRHRLHEDDGTPLPFVPTPNHGGEVEPVLLVMHYTAGRSAASSISWLANPQARASAHLVIGRDGSLTQMVPFHRVAWHAGRSEWLSRPGVNDFSLGIELDNAGRLNRHGERWRAWFGGEYDPEEVLEATHKHQTEPAGWHTFPEVQIEAAVAVATLLVNRYELRDVVGHEDISPGRKEDPGPAFPLLSFRSRVLGRSVEQPEIAETTATLNIRQGPGPSFDPVPGSPLPPGTKVEIVGLDQRWRRVEVLDAVNAVVDLEGWVHGRHLRHVEPASG